MAFAYVLNLLLGFTVSYSSPLPPPVNESATQKKPYVAFRVTNIVKNERVINIVTDTNEREIRDESGFVTAYLLVTYLVKRQVHINNYVFFNVHQSKKLLLLNSLDDLQKYLKTRAAPAKTFNLVKSMIAKIKPAEKIEAAVLLRMILEIEGSLQDTNLTVQASTRDVGQARWGTKRSFSALKLPSVSDGQDLIFQ